MLEQGSKLCFNNYDSFIEYLKDKGEFLTYEKGEG